MVGAVCADLAAPGTLDTAALDRTAAILSDTIGVVIAGGREPEMQALAAPGALWREPAGEATVFVAGVAPTSAERAAFLNGTAGTFLELDEGVRPTGHPAVQVVPAALAAAEELGVSGRRLLLAVVAGYEVAARLFAAYALRPPTHPHGHLGGIGAAVAVALLSGADPLAAARIAATLPLLTTWSAPLEGATARNAWSGSAAANGVSANRLAAAGFIGSRAALDDTFGGLVGELAEPAALAAPVRLDELAIWRNYVKLQSACALTHAAIEAAQELPRVAPASIRRVTVRTVANNLKVAAQPRPNDLSARFSIPYGVAAGLLGRAPGVAPAAYDAEVGVLAERVEVDVDPELTALWPRAAPAEVEIETEAGVTRARVDNPLGFHERPADATALRAKFEALVGPSLGDGTAPLRRALLGIADCDDVAAAIHWRAS